jgi:hypothetical protein
MPRLSLRRPLSAANFSVRAHMITRLEELIVHMKERGAWFATLSEIADATERAVQGAQKERSDGCS